MSKLPDVELPLGKRSKTYRFFEILTPVITFSLLFLTFLLSIWEPIVGAVYILILIVAFFTKGMGVAYSMLIGHNNYNQSIKIDWHQRLLDLDRGIPAHNDKSEFLFDHHLQHIKVYQNRKSNKIFVNDVYHLIIVAAYNEPFEVIDQTMKTLLHTVYQKQRMIICLAYEDRGGALMEETAFRIKDKYEKDFHSMFLVKHPSDTPNEVIGKGANITYAAKTMVKELSKMKIATKNVIITTLDSDNKPHPMYFDCVTYEYVCYKDRKHLSFQPISLFLNNIWEVSAPARIIATGNSLWNLICSARPYALRNFASHSQPLSALKETNFWSVRTIVEDGHQYWRSYFHFRSQYFVVPIYLPIYQDAVQSETYYKSMRAQFIQLRRWAYGVSDVPFVAINLIKGRSGNIKRDVCKLIALIENNVSLALGPIIITFGGWIPLFFNSKSYSSFAAHQLPIIIKIIQQTATIGIIMMIIFSFLLLPPKPKHYSKMRYFSMLLQWVLIPFTAIIFSSITSLYAQYRLMVGKYLNKFDVTEKVFNKR